MDNGRIMLSVSSVRSSGGAANYFAKDNYYTVSENEEAGIWHGKGAADLGLRGTVQKEAFEDILNGKLPNGQLIEQKENRKLGMDLTFSMPKSASIMAYIVGDDRILAAHMSAVKKAVDFIERNYAEARVLDEKGGKEKGPRQEAQKTGNLVVALFAHDTSRALDPQGHIHAVIANLTKDLSGKWKALWNGEIWRNNTVIGQAYHAAFRAELQKLGYETVAVGKHGSFEIKGVPKELRDEFSKRTDDINAKIKELGVQSDYGKKQATLSTRDDKINVTDRAALVQDWKDRAEAIGKAVGFDGKALHQAALERAGERQSGIKDVFEKVVDHIRESVGDLFRSPDPLVPSRAAALFMHKDEVSAHHAVASAIRHLSEREAAFE
ncbi:MAG: conjugative relaxase, partial [Gammaproteobacteria bacterium]